jgi:hypothetical protein
MGLECESFVLLNNVCEVVVDCGKADEDEAREA